MSRFLLYNGNIMPNDELRISPINRGMMYGDGCFETLRGYNGKFLHFAEHLNRLQSSLSFLGMDPIFEASNIRKKLQDLIEANGLSDKQAIIRIQCWRQGDRGYASSSTQKNYIIEASQLNRQIQPLSLITAKTPAIPEASLSRNFKLSNSINYIMAAKEASAAGAGDALMLTLDGSVSECTKANIFWGRGNRVFTPSKECDLLPGITRQFIINFLQKNGEWQVFEEAYSPEVLEDAEFMFTTNSLHEITVVHRLNEIYFSTQHPSLERIQALFEAYKNRNLT